MRTESRQEVGFEIITNRSKRTVTLRTSAGVELTWNVPAVEYLIRELRAAIDSLPPKRIVAETNHGADIDFQIQQRKAHATEVAADPRAAFKPELITVPPLKQPYLERGEACWCNLGKDCTGSHEITVGDPIHVCGECGEEFKIDKSDPHWSTGRGPLCPKRKRKP